MVIKITILDSSIIFFITFTFIINFPFTLICLMQFVETTNCIKVVLLSINHNNVLYFTFHL